MIFTYLNNYLFFQWSTQLYSLDENNFPYTNPLCFLMNYKYQILGANLIQFLFYHYLTRDSLFHVEMNCLIYLPTHGLVYSNHKGY